MSNDVISKLKQAYVSGGKGKKVSDEQVESIGGILVKEFINKNKTFTTRDVAEIMKAQSIGDFSKNANPEHARLSSAYNVLVRLQVIPKKEKKVVEPETTPEA